MRIMVDTNVIISAILFPDSIPSAAIIKVLKQHRLVLCSQIEDELFAIFEKKFGNKLPDLRLFIDKLSYELVSTPSDIDRNDYPVIRDEADLPILAAALNAKVDLLLSGDNDFLALQNESLSSLTILSPKEYVENY